MPRGLWDLSSAIKDRTHALTWEGRAEAYPPEHQGSPRCASFPALPSLQEGACSVKQGNKKALFTSSVTRSALGWFLICQCSARVAVPVLPWYML